MNIKDIDIDILLPTSKKLDRLDNLLCQIYACLNSGLKTRVTIGMTGDYRELYARLTKDQIDKIRFIKDCPEGGEVGHPALKYMLENFDYSDWITFVNDDDCTPSWALKHLWDKREGVSMVLGQAIGVSRERHFNLSAWKLGPMPDISINHICAGNGIYNMRSLEKLPKPWWNLIRTGDYDFVKRMEKHFPYKIIPSVVLMLSFAELSNLGVEFNFNFNKAYGKIL